MDSGFFHTASGVLAVIGSLKYIWAILHGAKPKRVTWFIWGTLNLIILASMWEGGRETNWQIIVFTVNAWTVALLALRYGVPGWNRMDAVCAAGAAISLALLRGHPQWALGLSLAVTCWGAMPTIMSAWQDPARENLTAWMIGAGSSVLLFVAIPWTFTAAAQPVTFFLVNASVAGVIFFRRHR